ncbi:unnamed protein product [Rotaria magnacalcarata]
MNTYQKLYNINNNCIIVGDLNATLSEMGSTKTNARGKQLQELLNENIIDRIDDDKDKWTKFRSKLDQQLMLWNNDTSLNAALNIEEHSTFITNSIMLETKEAVPTPTPTSKSYPLSEASKSLITMKHQAYRR